jgi:hypothetical protein
MTRVTVLSTTSTNTADIRWWSLDHARMREALWSAFGIARKASEGRAKAYQRLRELADHGVVLDEGMGEGGDTHDAAAVECAENVIAQVIETAATKLLDSRPDVQILTDGGQDTAQMRAKELASWTNAASRAIGLYDVVEEAWDEAMAVGTGAFRVFEENGRPTAEVAYCEDLHVNPKEAKHNAVRTLYYERTVDRAQLAALFPLHRNKIAKSGQGPTGMDAEELAAENEEPRIWSDMVTVVEAWRLAVGPKVGDEPMSKHRAGRHVIALEDVTLLDEPYECDELPFRFLRWRKRRRSFWGKGIAEGCEGMQSQMNLHAGTIEETLEAMVPAYWTEDDVSVEKIDNVPGRIYKSPSGKPPTPMAVHPGLLAAHTERESGYRTRMFTSHGVSEMEGHAQKPAGLNSGKAQLVHQDIKSKRLLIQGRQIEDAYAWAFRKLIDVADAIVEMGEEGDSDALTYLAGEGGDIKATAFADVRIRDFMFEARVFPVSKLPDSPAGRLEFVAELLQLGVIPPGDAFGLLALPDLEGYAASKDSMRKLAKAFVDHASTGDYDGQVAKMLTPMDDFKTVIEYGHQQFANLRLRGKAPEELNELQAVITRATDMQADAQRRIAEEQAPPAVGSAAMPGPSSPPPTDGGAMPPLM